MGNGLSRRSRTIYGAAVVVTVCAAVAGVLIGASHPSSRAHHHGTVYVVVFAVVAAVVVAGLMVWSLRRQLHRPAMKRLLGFSYPDRRAAIRAVNSGTTLTQVQQDIARAQSEQLAAVSRRLLWVMPLAVILLVVIAVENVGGLRELWVVVAAFELLAMTASMLIFRRQRRRIERALLS